MAEKSKNGRWMQEGIDDVQEVCGLLKWNKLSQIHGYKGMMV